MIDRSLTYGLRDSIQIVFDNIKKDKEPEADGKKRWNGKKDTQYAADNLIPDAIRSLIKEKYGDRFKVRGQSGQSGNWNESLAIAIMDPNVCTNDKNRVTMQRGFYTAYLFSEYGERLYLTLAHATKNIKPEDLVANVAKIRSTIIPGTFRTDTDAIKLGSSNDYVHSIIVFKEYTRENLPNEQILIDDLMKMLEIYVQYLDQPGSGGQPSPSPSGIFPSTDFEKEICQEVYADTDTIKRMIDVLTIKQNLILQGPPGVGKTFIAKKLAYLMMGSKKDENITKIQFHQSYGYEEFIYGLRPVAGGSFEFKPGVFFKFCKTASEHPESKYFFIIDEINRANISRVFGETMMLVESGYRGTEPITLMYNDVEFSIPKNVYLIGTMNTADRSIAMMDYALRRRFGFVSLSPQFDRLEKEGKITSKLKTEIDALNKEIADDPSLGDGFLIGHSYFIDNPNHKFVIENEIEPLLKEYWYDDRNKTTGWIDRLNNALKN